MQNGARRFVGLYSHYLVVKTGKEKEQEVNINVEKGRIEKAEEYKYLGTYITASGTIEKHLEEIHKKMKGMIR